jgi:hypothetical protein
LSIAEKKRQKQKKDQQYLMIFRGGLIGLLLGVFGWLVHNRLLEASLFLAVGVVYSILVWRVTSQSGRAFNVMLWSLLLNFYTLISIDVNDVLAVPAASPWFFGFLMGGIAGGHVWLGPRAGTQFVPKNKRRPDVDGNYPGGWRLALINGVCAIVLLGIGTAQLVLLSPTILAVAVLMASFIAGWILFRFPPALQVRHGLVLLGLPVVFFALGFLGGAIDQIALPLAWAYGVLAGILIGGRYWSGPRFGAPRPPFNSQYKRRRRKKRRPRSQKKLDSTKHQKPPVGASHK